MLFSNRHIATLIAALAVSTASFAQPTPVEKSFLEWEQYTGPEERDLSVPEDTYVISILSQKDLEELSSAIIMAIKQGQTDIEVIIKPGVLRYDRTPVFLSEIDAGKVTVSIKGDNTVLVAGGKDYDNGGLITSPSRNRIYLDDKLNLIELYGDVIQADDAVEIIDRKEKLCRVAVSQPFLYSPGMRMQLSEWYKSPIYKVTEIKDGFVYFIADDLKYDNSKKCYNVQYDNTIASMNPRFRFVEVDKAKSYDGSIHECSVTQFAKLNHVKLKSFSISGISFNGGAKGEEAFFSFRDVDAEKICISDCRFENILPRLVSMKKTGRFVFKDNVVRNCYAGAFYSDQDCPEIIVRNNYFYRAEKGWTNSSCVVCYGVDFLIADNVFEDVSYSSIRTGYHLSRGDVIVSKGVIENNEIFFGDEYYTHPEKYSLVDGGAIYIGTLTRLVVVRYNFIHNYRGTKSNRAIYCDDGAMNVKIYGNVISGITNAHSMFSWKSTSVNKKYPESNDGIDVYYNVIWGNYKFEERPNSSCIHGKNLILYADGEKAPENVLKNFAYKEKDLVFSGVTLENGKMKIPEAAKQELRKFPTYEKMKHCIE